MGITTLTSNVVLVILKWFENVEPKLCWRYSTNLTPKGGSWALSWLRFSFDEELLLVLRVSFLDSASFLFFAAAERLSWENINTSNSSSSLSSSYGSRKQSGWTIVRIDCLLSFKKSWATFVPTLINISSIWRIMFWISTNCLGKIQISTKTINKFLLTQPHSVDKCFFRLKVRSTTLFWTHRFIKDVE